MNHGVIDRGREYNRSSGNHFMLEHAGGRRDSLDVGAGTIDSQVGLSFAANEKRLVAPFADRGSTVQSTFRKRRRVGLLKQSLNIRQIACPHDWLAQC